MGAALRVGVLALQGDFQAHARALERVGARPLRVRREKELDGLAALVLPCGESTTISKGLERLSLYEPLANFAASGRPILGTCAGAVLLAEMLGWHDPEEQKSDPMEDPQGDWDFPAFTLEMCSRLSPFWSEVVDDLKQEDISVYAGQYVHAPDDQPLIGPVPEVPGFYVNCGYWAGVMLSPEAGKRIANLATGEMDPRDNPLRPTRFKEGLGKKGKTLMSH